MISLVWGDASDNEVTFEIERSTDNGATFAPRSTAPQNTSTRLDGDLEPGKTYLYRVRAVNAARRVRLVQHRRRGHARR